MSDPKVRRDVACVAARMMYERTEKEYFTAKRKAARQLGLDRGTFFSDLPSNAEIRDQIDILAQMHEGETRQTNLLQMRLVALRFLRLLEPFHPKLIGSTLTGHIRRGSDIDIHVFSDNVGPVTEMIEGAGHCCDVEHKRVVKHAQERVFTHIHLSPQACGDARFAIELTLYKEDQRSFVFRSSITGKPIEKANGVQLLELLRRVNPDLDIEHELSRLESCDEDRFELFRLLLIPLESVKQNPKHHPEGDALYHSMQVFLLAQDAKPWDEEFLIAALLHDVGKAIDPRDHVQAGLGALGESITERTQWLIEHHMDALHLHDGTLGHRAAQRLRENPDFDDLMLLRELDTKGRRGGIIVPTIDEALEMIRSLAEQNDGA